MPHIQLPLRLASEIGANRWRTEQEQEVLENKRSPKASGEGLAQAEKQASSSPSALQDNLSPPSNKTQDTAAKYNTKTVFSDDGSVESVTRAHVKAPARHSPNMRTWDGSNIVVDAETGDSSYGHRETENWREPLSNYMNRGRAVLGEEVNMGSPTKS